MIAYVEDGAVKFARNRAPNTIRVPHVNPDTGESYTFGLAWAKATPEQRRAAGWYDVKTVNNNYDPFSQDVSGETFVVRSDHVERHPTITNLTIEKVRDKGWEEIKAWRAERFNDPFGFGGKFFQSDESSREKIQAVYSAALGAIVTSSPYSVSYTAIDNTDLVMDAATAMSFAMTLFGRIDALHTDARTSRESIKVMTDPAYIRSEVRAYKLKWPAYDEGV